MKIVIITREDFKTIMSREHRKDMETINSGNIHRLLGASKYDIEEKTSKLHIDGDISDIYCCIQLVCIKRKFVEYSRVKKNAKYFTMENPGYNYTLFKTHK